MRILISKFDTMYRKAIHVEMSFCIIYKLVHGANILTCSELFVVGGSTMGLVLREVMMAINIVSRKLIT